MHMLFFFFIVAPFKSGEGRVITLGIHLGLEVIGIFSVQMLH